MTELKVAGMSCGHCEKAVEAALAAVPGVSRVVNVDHQLGVVQVDGSPQRAALVAAIEEEGYQVVDS